MSVIESPAEIANRILRESAYRPLRFLTCSFDNGILIIGGRLPSYHMKQIAQTAVRNIAGVSSIDNRVEVSG